MAASRGSHDCNPSTQAAKGCKLEASFELHNELLSKNQPVNQQHSQGNFL